MVFVIARRLEPTDHVTWSGGKESVEDSHEHRIIGKAGGRGLVGTPVPAGAWHRCVECAQ